ncbi:MAG TPA: cytochrome c maturation protein CcmE [Solirubrobacteraceae bacterium]|jgi:cytochrome c-type biogenesis protein CcmE|nr:cytochrome c maturation protein CcmE [Solirubrobacteraceae bacterium]
MDPSRKRRIRLTVALTAALLLASALIYTSFSAGQDVVTASQLLKRARPGETFILGGTVVSEQHEGSGELLFRVRDPKLDESVPVRYSGLVPDPFAVGRGVLVTVQQQGASFVGQPGSLTTKCPSKFQDANATPA